MVHMTAGAKLGAEVLGTHPPFCKRVRNALKRVGLTFSLPHKESLTY